VIFWTFEPHEIETKPAWKGAPLRSWRRVLKADGGAMGVEHEVMGDDGTGAAPWDGKWWDSGCYALVGVAWEFQFGLKHAYYDGQHWSIWLGCFYVTWSR